MTTSRGEGAEARHRGPAGSPTPQASQGAGPAARHLPHPRDNPGPGPRGAHPPWRPGWGREAGRLRGLRAPSAHRTFHPGPWPSGWGRLPPTQSLRPSFVWRVRREEWLPGCCRGRTDGAEARGPLSPPPLSSPPCAPGARPESRGKRGGSEPLGAPPRSAASPRPAGWGAGGHVPRRGCVTAGRGGGVKVRPQVRGRGAGARGAAIFGDFGAARETASRAAPSPPAAGPESPAGRGAEVTDGGRGARSSPYLVKEAADWPAEQRGGGGAAARLRGAGGPAAAGVPPRARSSGRPRGPGRAGRGVRDPGGLVPAAGEAPAGRGGRGSTALCTQAFLFCSRAARDLAQGHRRAVLSAAPAPSPRLPEQDRPVVPGEGPVRMLQPRLRAPGALGSGESQQFPPAPGGCVLPVWRADAGAQRSDFFSSSAPALVDLL